MYPAAMEVPEPMRYAKQVYGKLVAGVEVISYQSTVTPRMIPNTKEKMARYKYS